MTHELHGLTPPSLFNVRPDPRINELDWRIRQLEALVGSSAPGSFLLGDPARVLGYQQMRLEARGEILYGLVVHSIAGLGWYKVQLGPRLGFLPCCLLSHLSTSMAGPREVGALPPNTPVLVFHPRGSVFGVILGAVPPSLSDGRLLVPDWIVQGGGSGYRREDLHTFPSRSFGANSGFLNFACQTPLDATALERGWITPSGIALILDDFLAQLRVNEQCGLWLSYFDSYARLAGVHLLIESGSHEEEGCCDEGESRWFYGCAAYPWEALGLQQPGQDAGTVYPDEAVQFTDFVGKRDLQEGNRDLLPAYRYQEYGGYLGQGRVRLVVRPAEESLRKSSSALPDENLFHENISLDGAYHLRSAKSIYIGKRGAVPAPRLRRLPQDGQGDDAQKNNYRFSGMFGGGQVHLIGDLRYDSAMPGLARPLSALDWVAYAVQWKFLHPFHYHAGDFHVPQPAEASRALSRSMAFLNFDTLKNQAVLLPPTPRSIRIDHRYGNVTYYENESHIVLHDDGSVMVADGYGASVVLSGGKVRIETAGDIELCAGRTLVLAGNQVIVKANGSVDVTSSNKDVRIKAENNLHLLAGNSGEGSLLLESKSSGAHDFSGLGEESKGSGIVFKAGEGVLAGYAKSIYMRTLSEGQGIVLDADQGHSDIALRANSLRAFCAGDVEFGTLAAGKEASEVTGVSRLGSRCVLNGPLTVAGSITAYAKEGRAGLTIDGDVYATGAIACGGIMADSKGGMLARVPDAFASQLQLATQNAAALDDSRRQITSSYYQARIGWWYGSGQPGDEQVIDSIAFSFRDDQEGRQYQVQDFVWMEPRWQALVRLGAASGGEPWREQYVFFRGEKTYPWPGRKAYENDGLVRYRQTILFDAANGRDRDRPALYESGQLESLERVPLENNWMVVGG